MAKAKIMMPDELLLKLSTLGKKTDEIIPKMLEEGGDIVYNKVKSNLKAVISNDPRNKGILVNNLEKGKPSIRAKDDMWAMWIGFTKMRRVRKERNKMNRRTIQFRKNSYANLVSNKPWRASKESFVVTDHDIAHFIEYGNRKERQPPRPFFEPAVRSTKKAVISSMEKKFEEEYRKL